MSRATYDHAARRWRGWPSTWPRAGSLRGGVASAGARAVRDGAGLLAMRVQPMEPDLELLRNKPHSFSIRHMVIDRVMRDDRFNPAWCEWLMGFAAGWTRRG